MKAETNFKLDFIVGGCRKSGTSWLYELFRSTPQVCVSEQVKESHFFCTKFENGIDWYRTLFPADRSNKVVGEVDPLIFVYPQAVYNIKQTFPDVKLIFILRRPPDLAHSGYMFALREATFAGTEAERWKSSEFARRDVSFYSVLKPFYDSFGADRILVMLYDDLRADPHAFFERICKFIDVEAKTDPSLFEKKFNSAAISKVPWLTDPVQKAKRGLRNGNAHWFINIAKKTGCNHVFSKCFYHRDIPQSHAVEKMIVRDTYDEVVKASELTGIDLVSRWQYSPELSVRSA